MTAFLPKLGEAMVDSTGQPRPAYRRWMQAVSEVINRPATATPDPTPAPDPISFVINGSGSVTADGSVAGGEFVIGLDNDKDEPGPTKFYGTDSAGNRGFVALSEGLEAGTGIALTDSGYTMLPSVAAPGDLPLTGNANEAVRVTDEAPGVYAWDGSAFTLDTAADGKAGIVLDATADLIGYDNATSGLAATDVQAAVDQLADEKLDSVVGGSHISVDSTDPKNPVVSVSGISTAGYAEGAANPASPALNDKFYRTDLNLLIYYDGTRWLTVQEYELAALVTNALQPYSTSNTRNLRFSNPSSFGIYLTSMACSTLVAGTSNSTNYWTVALEGVDSANAGTTIATFDTKADASNTWVAHDQAINAVLGGTSINLGVSHTKISAPGNLLNTCALRYRQIVT